MNCVLSRLLNPYTKHFCNSYHVFHKLRFKTDTFPRNFYTGHFLLQELDIQQKRIRGKEVMNYWNTLHIDFKSKDDEDMRLEEWDEVSEKLSASAKLSNLWAGMLLSSLTNSFKIKRGQSLYKYIQRKGIHRSVLILSSYMQLCGLGGYGVHQEDILKTYEELKKTGMLFNQSVIKSITVGLSKTDQWRECLHLLREMENLAPKSNLSSAYANVIVAAAHVGDYETVSQLLRYFGEKKWSPSNNVYDAVLEVSEKNDSFIDFFMNLMVKNRWIPNQENAYKIKQFYKNRRTEEWKSYESFIKFGRCNASGHKVQEYKIPDTEFQKLRDNFMQNCVIGEDIYLRTNPAELERYQAFIDSIGEIDVMVDGLNVSFMRRRENNYRQVISLVKTLVLKHKFKVLVVTRAHQKDKRLETQELSSYADIFFVENISNDDVFLLYAALYNGEHTLIISKDKMRQHSHLMADEYRELFVGWLKRRLINTVFVKNDRHINFKFPSKHDIVVQRSEQGWHIPYQEQNESEIKNWLFLKQIKTH